MQNDAMISPTILENVSKKSERISDETVGPVMPLIQFADTDELITEINSTAFGLQVGIYTQSIELAKKFFHEVEVGAVIMNQGPGFRQEHLPFGGVKDSGLGREGIRYGIEEMTYLKTLIL